MRDESVDVAVSQRAARPVESPAAVRLTGNVRVSFVVVLILVAFVLRIVAALILHRVIFAAGATPFFMRGDEESYDYTAWQLAQVWRGQLPMVHPSYAYLVNAYTRLGGVVYFIVGHQIGAMIALNCLFGALAAGMIYLVTRRLFGEVAARFAGIAAAFFPSLFFWSLFNLKDTMFLLCLSIVLWAMVGLLQTGERRWFVPIVLAVLVLGTLRFYVQGLLAVLLPGAILLQSRAALPRKYATAALMVVACGLLVLLTGAGGWLANTLPTFATIRYQTGGDAGSLFVPKPTPQSSVATGAAPIPVESDAATRRGALKEIAHWLPTGMAYALAAPFPWAVRRAVEVAAMPEVFCWYGAMVLAAVGAVVQRRKWRYFLAILAYVAAMMLVLSIAESTVGTLLRHRMMVILPLLVLSGAGAGWLWERGWQRTAAKGVAHTSR